MLTLEKPERGENSAGMLAGFWVHVRRKFFDLHANGESELATATVERMKRLWAVEIEVRGQQPHRRVAARRRASAPIIDELFALWEKELGRISQKSKLADAIRYAFSRRRSLERFLDDGRIETDSNIIEQAIRLRAITRKNAFFAGSDGGWPNLGDRRQPAPDRQDERRRSLRLVEAHAGASRQRLAQQPYRRAHALELQAV